MTFRLFHRGHASQKQLHITKKLKCAIATFPKTISCITSLEYVSSYRRSSSPPARNPSTGLLCQVLQPHAVRSNVMQRVLTLAVTCMVLSLPTAGGPEADASVVSISLSDFGVSPFTCAVSEDFCSSWK